MVQGVPVAYSLTCPREKSLHRFTTVDGGVSFICSGCEWRYTLSNQLAGITQPAVPASTITQANTSGTVAAVTLSGFTLTAVKINTVTVGSTNALYFVPVGGTIAVTYTVLGTWTWALPQISSSMSIGAVAAVVNPVGTNVAFTQGQLLVIDSGASTEILTVGAGSTATSITVAAALKAHSSSAAFGVLAVVPTYSGVGEDAVPAAAGWGY